jgi:vacuolar-type H+-ATPase subunit I/STV1
MKVLIWVLVIIGAATIVTPAIVYPDLSLGQLVIKCWSYFGAGLVCEVAAILLRRLETDAE